MALLRIAPVVTEEDISSRCLQRRRDCCQPVIISKSTNRSDGLWSRYIHKKLTVFKRMLS